MYELDGVRKRDLKHLIHSLKRQLDEEILKNRLMEEFILSNNMYEKFWEFQKNPNVVPMVEPKQ